MGRSPERRVVARRRVLGFMAASGGLVVVNAALDNPLGRVFSSPEASIPEIEAGFNDFRSIVTTHTTAGQIFDGLDVNQLGEQFKFTAPSISNPVKTTQYRLTLPQLVPEKEAASDLLPTFQVESIDYGESDARVAKYFTIATFLDANGKPMTRNNDRSIIVTTDRQSAGEYPLSKEQMIARGKSLPASDIIGIRDSEWSPYDRLPGDSLYYSYSSAAEQPDGKRVKIIMYETGLCSLTVSIPKK